MFLVKIKNGVEFKVKPSQNLLEGAISSGINLPYGCRSGSCGACKTKILDGEVFHSDIMPGVLTDKDKEQGKYLICRAHAASDLIIEDSRFDERDEPDPQITPVRVEEINKLNHDVIQIYLKLPGVNSLDFYAGQYLEFILADGSKRAFSMASCPGDDLIELHIRLIEGGKFTNFIFSDMKEKSIHRIEAPLGSFYLRDSDKPIIFIAGGTGFAPIKSIINDMLRKQNNRKIILYRGARTYADLYEDKAINEWIQSDLDISVENVLSDEKLENFKHGLVHQQVLMDERNIKDYQIYCCGSPGLVEAAYKDFVKNGLPDSEFYSDAFTFAPR